MLNSREMKAKFNVLVERYEDFGGRPFVDGTSSHHVSVYRRAEES